MYKKVYGQALNTFYCVFQSIDKEIAFVLRKIEKDLKLIPESLVYFRDIPINSLFISDHRVFKKTEEVKAKNINTDSETSFLPDALIQLVSE